MKVDVTLLGAEDEFKLNVIPELQSLSPESLGLSSLELFRAEYNLNLQGERRKLTQQRDIYDVLSLDAFSLPALNLSVPATPVGVGASWTEINTQSLVNSTTSTTVNAIDDDTITVSKLINVGTDEQQRYTVSASMEAIYSLPSLLMKSADIALSIRFEDDLYVNGILQPVVDTRTYTQTVREEAL